MNASSQEPTTPEQNANTVKRSLTVPPPLPGGARRLRTTVAVSGLALLALTLAIARLASRFYYGGEALERPIPLFVILLGTAGAIYLVAVAALAKTPDSRGLLVWILGVGIVARAIMIPTTPMLEDDYYRYLWDGGVTASGHNPYAYIPQDVFDAKPGGTVPQTLLDLAAESGVVAQRVSHSHLGTIYPPVAQASFALAHGLKPWSLQSWRAVLLGFDLAALGLVIALLRRLGKPLHHAAIYWWNPLVIQETVNAAHMDALILPFVLAALLFALGNKTIRSGFALALAIAVKIWPIILIPLLLRAIQTSWKRAAAAAALSAALLAILALPMLASVGLGGDSGFSAYGKKWEMNDALFMVFHKATTIVCAAFGLDGEGTHVELAARAEVALALILWIAWVSHRKIAGPQDLCNRIVLVLGALFLLSPTQFPWYYLWLVPFLALSPRPSLLLLTAMLPIYYLKFYFDARGNVTFFHNRVVWFEYAPVFALILFEWYAAIRRTRRPASL